MKPDYDVHYVLGAVGLEDVATFLRPEQRQPPDLTARRKSRLMTGQWRVAAPVAVHDGDRVFVPRLGVADCGDDPAYCFPAMDETGQYERADARRGGTAWDMARALAPGAVFLPDCRRGAIVRGTSRPGTSEFPRGWDADMITSAVLAVARDPDRITWDDPAAWPGTEITGRPCWRAEGTAGAVAITVALSADGEIIGARSAQRPDDTCGLWPPPAATGQPGKDTRQRERARA
jgi:hypothetical protein